MSMVTYWERVSNGLVQALFSREELHGVGLRRFA